MEACKNSIQAFSGFHIILISSPKKLFALVTSYLWRIDPRSISNKPTYVVRQIKYKSSVCVKQARNKNILFLCALLGKYFVDTNKGIGEWVPLKITQFRFWPWIQPTRLLCFNAMQLWRKLCTKLDWNAQSDNRYARVCAHEYYQIFTAYMYTCAFSLIFYSFLDSILLAIK